MVAPSKKVTLPTALAGVTVAVSVTGAPKTDGFGDVESETPEAACAAPKRGNKIGSRASSEEREDRRQAGNMGRFIFDAF
jgi:hypothetical protein